MSDHDERLREILRQGDPATGDPGLTTEEVRAMRRAVLSAVPEPRRRGWLVPALATAAVLVLAVALALSLWRTGSVETARRPEPSPPWPPSPSPAFGRPNPSPGEGGTASQGSVGAPLSRRGGRGGGRGVGGEGLRRPPSPTPPEERSIRWAPVPEPDTTVAKVEPPPAPPITPPAAPEGQHQIQFSTPGGTRVIWLLNPATE
jgi:hypothetical protein